MRFFGALAALALAAPLAAALPKISRKGRYLYDESGDRFYIKGVAYQPQGELAAQTEANDANGGFPEPSSYIDPLSSGANCTRDLPYLKQLGVNAVRVYSVNPNANHDACMALFNSAGIYVLLDVSLPLNGSIDRASPAWTTNLLNEYLTTINKFEAYQNVLGYNVGNEVVTKSSNTDTLPFVKAAARDVKAYLKSINSTALVGYAATDGAAEYRQAVSEYLTCGADDQIVDLFGLNSYAWCGDSTYTASGWVNVVSDFKDLTVPVYMSEFGCVDSPPRVWNEVASLYSSPMSDVFSGGMAFSYFQANVGAYGLVDISSDGKTVTTSTDFTRLATQFNATKPPNSPAATSNTELKCPAESTYLLASTTLPPTPNQEICECVNNNALGCHTKPLTAFAPMKIGALIDYACSLLGQANASVTCAGSIGGNGTTGEYGPLSMCSPEIKLNWAMSAYWVSTNKVATSCDFGGNATVFSLPSDVDSNAAADACLSGKPSVSTPTATNAPAPPAPTNPSDIPTEEPAASSSTTGSNSNKGGNNGATSLGVSAAAVVLTIGSMAGAALLF